MSSSPEPQCLDIIARVHTPFKEKFGIPRQPGLAAAKGRIEMLPPWNRPELFDGLGEYSHIWLNFLFHQAQPAGWRDKVRPPRLGGNTKKGVFATRSPFRPNHLGLSVVKLLGLQVQAGSVVLEVEGVDLLDQTPIVDIRPYVPYVDAIPDARSGFSPAAPEKRLAVVFSPQADKQLLEMEPSANEAKDLIRDLLSLDPRPAYHKDERRIYGMRLFDVNVKWSVDEDQVTVHAVEADPSV